MAGVVSTCFFSLDLVWCIWKVRVVCEYDWDKILMREGFGICCCPFYICVKRFSIFVFYSFFPEGRFGLDFFGFSSCWGLFQNSRYWQRIGQVWNIEKQGFSFSCHCFVFFLLLGLQTWDAGVNLGSERKGIFLCLVALSISFRNTLLAFCWREKGVSTRKQLFGLVYFFTKKKIQSCQCLAQSVLKVKKLSVLRSQKTQKAPWQKWQWQFRV